MASAKQLPPVEVLGVRVPPGERRVPVALTDVKLGPVRLTCVIAREGRGKGNLVLRLPKTAADNSAGVVLPEALFLEVEEACLKAVGAYPGASVVLLRRGERWPV